MKGMQKISRGRGFRGALDYAFDREAGKEKGALIGGNMSCCTPRELASEFGAARKLRPDIKKPVWHNSLRLPKGDRLTPEEWSKLADDYMARMGFSELHQRVYVLHDDLDGQHIHIISNRVALDGTVFLGQNENLASTQHIQALERAYGLTITKGAEYDRQTGKVMSPNHAKLKKGEQELGKRIGEPPTKLQLQHIIDGAVGGAPSAVEFVARLAKSGVSARANVASTGRMNGFAFELAGITFKGSDLGKSYTWKGLEARGVTYDPQRDLALPIPIAQQRAQELGIHVRTAIPQHLTKTINQGPPPWRKGLHHHNDLPSIHEAMTGAPLVMRPAALRERQKAERQVLMMQHKAKRRELYKQTDSRGSRNKFKVAQMLLAKVQADEYAELRELQRTERDNMAFQSLPDYAEWRTSPEPTAEQNKELAAKRKADDEAVISGEGLIRHVAGDIRDFTARADSALGIVSFLSKSGFVAFVDTGNKIDVAMPQDPDAVLAALQLASKKYGKLTVTGNANFQYLCVQLAATHGFQFADPKLNAAVDQERERQLIENAQSPNMEKGQYRGTVRVVTAEAVFLEIRRKTLVKLPMCLDLHGACVGDRQIVTYQDGMLKVKTQPPLEKGRIHSRA